MANEHRTESQTTGPAAAAKAAHQAPEAAPLEALLSLQGSVGNATVSRMLGARDAAAAEAPTPVGPETQDAIRSRAGGGRALEPWLREQMETVVEGDLSGVRIHTDREADALSRGLYANAFTQGQDVFLRSDRHPSSADGRITLAHELSHVARGGVGPGAVLREPAAPGSPQAEFQQSQASFLAPPPNMLMTDGPAAGAATAAPARAPGTADPRNLAPRMPDFGGPPEGLMYQPDPDPATRDPHQAGDTWDVEYTMYGRPEVFKGLDDEGAIRKLQGFYFAVMGDMSAGSKMQANWQKEMGERAGTRWAAAASSIVGGADWPDPKDWYTVEASMADAGQILRESLWAVMAAKNDPELDAGARAQARPLTEDRLNEVVKILELGDHDADQAWTNWKNFIKDTDKGASRAVTGLKVAKVAGAIAVTYLTAGAAAELELGFWGTTTAIAVAGGGYASGQELAGQGGEMLFGDRDHIDWGKVAKVGAVNAAAGFVGGAIGGKFAGVLGNSLGKMVGGLAPEVMETAGIEGAELLTNGEKIFVNWLGNTAASPFQTTTSVLMQSALDQKWSVSSTGDFFDLVLGDMVKNGTIGAFFSFAQAHGAGKPTTPGEPVSGAGEGGGGGEPGGGGQAGAGGGSPTLQGMGAAGPAGQGAAPRATAAETQTGMGAAGPAGENAAPRAIEEPASGGGDRETQQGMGAVGPAAAAEQITPIDDIADAQDAQWEAEANGEPYRWPRSDALVRDLWVREAGQPANSDPPAAWTGPNGLVVNGAIVPVPLRPPPAGSGTEIGMGVAAPRATEQGMGVAEPHDTQQMPAPDMRQTSPGMGEAGPGVTQVHDVGGAPTQQQDVATAPTEQQSAVDPDELETPADDAGDTQQGIGIQARPPGTPEVEIIDDPGEARDALDDAQDNDEPARWVRDPDLVKDLWVRESGQNPDTAPPAAWRGPKGLIVNGSLVPMDQSAGGAGEAGGGAGGGAEPAPAAGPRTNATNDTNDSSSGGDSGGGGPAYGRPIMSGPSNPAGQSALADITEAYGVGGPSAAAAVAEQQSTGALENAYAYLVAANQPGAALGPGAQFPTKPLMDTIWTEITFRIFPARRGG
jgi:hypothetical protein